MTTVTLTRSVAVAPEEAWHAWVDPDELARWWWPMLRDTTYDWKPRAGAPYTIHSKLSGFGVRGVFTEVEEPHRLKFEWTWVSDDDTETTPLDVVEVTFEAQGVGTLVTVRHSSSRGREDMDGLVQGWNGVLDRFSSIDQPA